MVLHSSSVKQLVMQPGGSSQCINNTAIIPFIKLLQKRITIN